MKSVSHANRGASFENYIGYANKMYRREGIAIIEKQYVEMLPIRDGMGRVVNVKICEKSTVDYIGRLGSTPIAIEAKHTSVDTIRFDAVQDHQSDFLTDYSAKEEGLAFVLVSFKLNAFYCIPWPFWKAARDAWKKAQWQGKKKAEQITIEYNGQTWTTPGKASVHAAELLPDWRVETGGRTGLDYLAAYK